jgi:hypothetical protein
VQVLLIPGNPGCGGFFVSFLQRLYDEMDGSIDAMAISALGQRSVRLSHPVIIWHAKEEGERGMKRGRRGRGSVGGKGRGMARWGRGRGKFSRTRGGHQLSWGGGGHERNACCGDGLLKCPKRPVV